jgi:hypothetical protein
LAGLLNHVPHVPLMTLVPVNVPLSVSCSVKSNIVTPPTVRKFVRTNVFCTKLPLAVIGCATATVGLCPNTITTTSVDAIS